MIHHYWNNGNIIEPKKHDIVRIVKIFSTGTGDDVRIDKTDRITINIFHTLGDTVLKLVDLNKWSKNGLVKECDIGLNDYSYSSCRFVFFLRRFNKDQIDLFPIGY